MKRLTLSLTALMVGGLVSVALAGDYHSGSTLYCNDCHTAHASISTGHGSLFRPDALGPNGPYDDLLLNEVNDLCLSCHNENTIAPDVFTENHGKYQNTVRRGGGLNAAPGHLSNGADYATTGGHTLWSSATPPGFVGTYDPGTHGLECTNCHAQHGHKPFQYRNLALVGTDTLSYASVTNNLSKDVFQVQTLKYSDDDVWFNEPDQSNSAYAKFCGNCHADFHGQGGDANMGSGHGGVATGGAWKRHPVADVNIGTSLGPHYSSLSQYNGRGPTGVKSKYRTKVMDPTGMHDGSSNQVTPSCFSCHRGHGNKNPFALIFLTGGASSTANVTEEGDGGTYKNLCRQCHVQGADS